MHLPAGGEWLVIGLVVLVLFGGERLPGLMRSVGKTMGEIQNGLEEGKRKLHEAIHDEHNP